MSANLKRLPAGSTATLKQAGGSLMVTVPARVRDELNLSAGMVMGVAVEDGRLVMQPLKPGRRKYSLSQLLAEESEVGIKPLDNVDRDWIDAPPKGREIW